MVTTAVVFVVTFCAAVVILVVDAVVFVVVVVVDSGVGYASSIGSCLTVIIFSIKDEIPLFRKTISIHMFICCLKKISRKLLE